MSIGCFEASVFRNTQCAQTVSHCDDLSFLSYDNPDGANRRGAC